LRGGFDADARRLPQTREDDERRACLDNVDGHHHDYACRHHFDGDDHNDNHKHRADSAVLIDVFSETSSNDHQF
jgi:hypothetical protein